jgi:hypothetical protein
MEIGCGGILVHDRSNFSKNKKLFPVFTTGGIVMWGSFMIYKCLKCHSTFNGNDGCFLSRLDDDVAAAYPVEPRYALANYRFHLSTDLTNDLRSTLLSNGSGDSFSAKLHHYQGNRFTNLVKTYASKAQRSRLGGGEPCNWTIKFSEWNGKFAPSGSQIRSYYLDGENSPLTSYQFSQYDRYKRELQQVGKDMSMMSAAVDWTFQVLKTYVSLPGAKACFTFKVSDGQMAGLAIVPSTALSQISHFLIQLVSRRRIQVQVLYTDLWPTGEVFWKNIFGAGMTGCLGMFHAMKRITDTFRKSVDGDVLQEAMNEFKRCFYSIDATDLSNLYGALKNGSMSQKGHRYTDDEVEQLEKSRFWSRRYGRFLKKVTHPSGCMQQMLCNFANKWKTVQDSKSRKLFTETTEKTIKEQCKNVVYVSDPHNMYKEVKAGPNSKHGLSEWMSLRMESQLEKGHHLMAHYGNTGMGTELADCLILRGVTETNTKVRFKSKIKDPMIPSHLEDLPLFLDESELAYVNCQLQEASLDPVFDVVLPLPPDNGEVFLSEYFFEQVKRNTQAKSLMDTKQNKCICPECAGFLFPIIASKQNPRGSVDNQQSSKSTPLGLLSAASTAPARRLPATTTMEAKKDNGQHPNSDSTSVPNTNSTLAAANTVTARSDNNGQKPITGGSAAVVLNKSVPAKAKRKKKELYPRFDESNEQTKTFTSVEQPFHIATNLLPNNIVCGGFLPPQCCIPYYPFYCQMQYRWRAQNGPAMGIPTPPHNHGCPGQRVRGAVSSPFMNLYPH